MKVFKQFSLLLLFQLSVWAAHANSANEVDKNWPDSVNTVKDAFYLSNFEKAIVIELNIIRSNPAKYVEKYLEPLKNSYDGLLFTYPGEIPLKTKEGVKALKECIRVMKSAEPAPMMTPSRGLCKAANLLVQDQKRFGGTGHATKSGWTPDVRVKRFGQYKSRLAENIVYGHEDARHAVISLLIDDGVSNRGHRKNILEPVFQKVGVAADEHPTYGYSCTIEFTDDYTEAK